VLIAICAPLTPVEEVSRSMIPDKRIAEVASRLTGIPTAELMQGTISERPRLVPMDSLETFASIMELEAEFDKETVEWALRFIDALAARPGARHDRTRRRAPAVGPGVGRMRQRSTARRPGAVPAPSAPPFSVSCWPRDD
jgi:hypothetical protein